MSEETPVRTTYPRMGADGPLGVIHIGHGKDGWRDGYHYLLTMPIVRFLGLLAAAYVAVNVLFALAYVTVGGVSGLKAGDFAGAFFFSVETLSTVGYGEMWPQSFGARSLMVVESFVGLLNLAIATGLLFARFSRPTARVMFSDKAVVTNFNGVPTLMFRAANRRRNRIVEAEVNLTLLREFKTVEGDSYRGFETLETLRAHHPVFILSWTIRHRIDAASPLFGETAGSLTARGAEIVVVLKGLDETFAQTIQARASYTPDEIAWGSKLVDIFRHDENGRRVIDYTHFHDIE